MTTRPRQGPQPGQARLDTVDPVERVVRAGRLPLLRQSSEADLVEEASRFGGCGRRAVVRQRHPRCQRLLAGGHRVVVLGAELVSQPALVLSLPASRHHGVDVHRVDLPGQPVTRCGVLGRAGGQQDEHDDGAELVVCEVRDAARRGDQP